MLNSLDQWLVDPAVQKLVISLVGLIVIAVAVQLLHRTLTHRIQQTDVRHRVRRLISFAGYLAGSLLVTYVVVEGKGHLTIASTTVQLVDPPLFDIRLRGRTADRESAER